MSKQMKFKTLALEIKEIKEEENEEGVKVGKIIGYAAVFNNIDFGNDRIMPGAFKRTIKSKKGKWPILADHNPTKMIGINVSAKEDGFGLLTESDINLETEKGREKFSLAKQALENEMPLGLSIGYRVVVCDFEEVKKVGMVRNLKELKLYEHSIVTFPMNEAASVTDVKSIELDDIKSHLDATIDRLKNNGQTAENIKQLVIESLKEDESFDDPNDLVHSLNNLTAILK